MIIYFKLLLDELCFHVMFSVWKHSCIYDCVTFETHYHHSLWISGSLNYVAKFIELQCVQGHVFMFIFVYGLTILFYSYFSVHLSDVWCQSADVQLYADPKEKPHHSVTQSDELSGTLNGSEIGDDYRHELYVRSNWQVQGFLKDKADLIEQ